jgi:hypothetical protein
MSSFQATYKGSTKETIAMAKTLNNLAALSLSREYYKGIEINHNPTRKQKTPRKVLEASVSRPSPAAARRR